MKEFSGLSLQPQSLHGLLQNADLLDYLDALKNVLKLRHAGDLCYADQEDLDRIGMSRPEQKRLQREYAKYFPEEKGRKGLVGKIKRKMFGRDEGRAGNGLIKREGMGGESLRGAGSNGPSEEGEEKQQQQQQHIIPAERISLCKEIGSGEFGRVFQAAWHREGPGSEGGGGGDVVTQVAVKRILPEKLISQPSSFLQEAAIMTRMCHENVIRLFGVVLDLKAVMLVSELAPCGSLLDCLQSPAWREPFSITSLCDFSLQIARGMRYLSSNRLIHRDLAARNVLVCSPTKVKISDFGLSRCLGQGEDYYRSEFSPSMKLPIGWCAPECINFLRFTSASDVWAFAVCLWEIFTFGRTPWANMTGPQILHAIDTQRRKLDRPEACPGQIYTLMLSCWEWEAEKRPSFEQICDQLPALFPPTLQTVLECRRRKEGHLEYAKGDTIVLIDKNTVYPGLWMGASKRGEIGYFRPEETIAFLGAENPTAIADEEFGSASAEVEEKGQNGKKKKREAKKANRKKEKEKKLVLISQPQGDLRHTCHVGADGRSFGLLNVDKNDLPRALPPTLASPKAHSPVAFPPLLCSSTNSLAPPRPPKGTAMEQMSRSYCQEVHAPSANAFGLSPQPPILPPKPPRFRTRPSQDGPPKSSQNGQIDYIKPDEMVPSGSPEEGTFAFPVNGQDRKSLCVEEEAEEEEEEEALLRPASICLEHLKEEAEKRADEERILHILSGLQKDLDDFSLSTLGDCSDGRPLLEGQRRRDNAFHSLEERKKREAEAALESCLPSVRTSLAFAMEPEEFERKSEEERRKTRKQLARLEEGTEAEGTGKSRGEEEEEEEKRKEKQPLENWPPEADQAYKLLVHYGHLLKAGHGLAANPKRERKSSPGCDQALTIHNPRNLHPRAGNGISEEPTQMEYLNPSSLEARKELDGPGKREERTADQNNDNGHCSAAQTKSRPRPPPVPPKPRMKLCAGIEGSKHLPFSG